MHKGLIEAFANSLHAVFLWAVPFGVVAFVVSLFLREVPLRERSEMPVGEVEGADFGLQPGSARPAP